jgi:hypothetical protein
LLRAPRVVACHLQLAHPSPPAVQGWNRIALVHAFLRFKADS